MTLCLSRLTLRQLPKADCRIYVPIYFRAYSLHQSFLNFQAISTSRFTMARKSGYKSRQSSGSSKKSGQPRRAPLTHFLCLPLVTEISKPQLEASLSQFQESLSIKFLDGLPADDDTPRQFGQAPRAPLIPPKAIRPVGTIHFTLGVMSLEPDERVQEAVEFLKGLDLRSMVEENLRANGTYCYFSSNPSEVSISSREKDFGYCDSSVYPQLLFPQRSIWAQSNLPLSIFAIFGNVGHSFSNW